MVEFWGSYLLHIVVLTSYSFEFSSVLHFVSNNVGGDTIEYIDDLYEKI